MTISFPASLPAIIGPASFTMRAVNQTAISTSPFTYKQQVVAHTGQRWEAEAQLPPMDRDRAEAWIGFLVSMQGSIGTFLMGDPAGATARGSVGGTPVVNGPNQTGGSLSISGASSSQTDWIRAGDYIQLNSGSSATLHKVLQDADSDGSGLVNLDIWPNIRSAPADASTVVVSSAVGVWRLNSGQQDWSISAAAIYGLSFAAVEAIA